MKRRFDDKDTARETVWNALQAQKAARFPFPPHGRIPNFKGAEEAARHLFEVEPWKSAKRIKVNPDSPQRPVREEALKRGITVYMPTPKLAGGFKKLDPTRIPPEKYGEAARLNSADQWAETIALKDMPQMDAIVCGSVAITRDGRRCGKGAGYSDMEFAILRELGHIPVLVATTVHPLQIVDDFPVASNDQPLSVIVTSEETLIVDKPPPVPEGIEWDRLSEKDLEDMPVLKELKEMRANTGGHGRG